MLTGSKQGKEHVALDGSSEGEVRATIGAGKVTKNHPADIQKAIAPNAFERAYLLAFPWSKARRHDVVRYPGRDAATIALFGNHIEAVRSWRKGWRKAPEWARDLLANHLDQISQDASAAAQALRQTERGAR
jgi:hypothetical protein